MMLRQVSTLGLLALLLAGCGSGDETNTYNLVPVRGNVTLDGKPIEGARVLFTPSEANKPNTPGSDTTGQEGNYKLMYRGRSGIAPGKYSVFVSKTIEPTDAKASEEFQDDPVLAGMAKERALTSQAAKGRGRSVASFDVGGKFEREVSGAGDVFDFDIKATAKKN